MTEHLLSETSSVLRFDNVIMYNNFFYIYLGVRPKHVGTTNVPAYDCGPTVDVGVKGVYKRRCHVSGAGAN